MSILIFKNLYVLIYFRPNRGRIPKTEQNSLDIHKTYDYNYSHELEEMA